MTDKDGHMFDREILEEKLLLAKNPPFIMLTFCVIGEETDIYKMVSVGRAHTMMFSFMSEFQPSKYSILTDVGDLMGELMDMSIMFSMWGYDFENSGEGDILRYTVWLKRLEQGQESNIDADMVEKFSKKVFGT